MGHQSIMGFYSWVSVVLFFSLNTATAQLVVPAEKPIFRERSLRLEGRLQQLTLKNVDGKKGEEIIVLERLGRYPEWKYRLSLWATHTNGTSIKRGAIDLPKGTSYYDFVPYGESSALILGQTNSIEVRSGNNWSQVHSVKTSDHEAFAADMPYPIRTQTQQALEGSFWIPSFNEAKQITLENGKPVIKKTLRFPMRNYARSSTEALPLELNYWFKFTSWFPNVVQGKIHSKDYLFMPWIDEVFMMPLGEEAPKLEHVIFRKLSERERDDRESNVIVEPIDLDGGGDMDFIVNKYKGNPSQMKAETSIHFTKNGVDAKGVKIKFSGNRASGAVAYDLNQDQKQDLVVASSQLNTWAIIRALTRKQVNVTFAFYFQKNTGYDFLKPDFSRVLTFRFDLSSLNIEGHLPSLTGDFNGDGYPDAFYAQDNNKISILLQNPNEKERYAELPSGEFKTSLIGHYRLGDLNGDGKSDVVLYDRKAKHNKRVKVLVNSGELR